MAGKSTEEAVISSGGADVDNPGACRACVGSTFVIVMGGQLVSAVDRLLARGLSSRCLSAL